MTELLVTTNMSYKYSSGFSACETNSNRGQFPWYFMEIIISTRLVARDYSHLLPLAAQGTPCLKFQTLS